MISLSFKSAKAGFFDRELILGAVDKATRRVLSKFGAFVRQRARTSIRKKKGISPPAGPPYSHVGLLRRFLFFAYDRDRKSVVIGPALLPGRSGTTAPELLEYGGSVPGKGRVAFFTNETGRDARGKFVSGGKTRVELNGRLRYRPRPFMGPAFEAERPGLESLWKDSVR